MALGRSNEDGLGERTSNDDEGRSGQNVEKRLGPGGQNVEKRLGPADLEHIGIGVGRPETGKERKTL